VTPCGCVISYLSRGVMICDLSQNCSCSCSCSSTLTAPNYNSYICYMPVSAFTGRLHPPGLGSHVSFAVTLGWSNRHIAGKAATRRRWAHCHLERVRKRDRNWWVVLVGWGRWSWRWCCCYSRVVAINWSIRTAGHVCGDYGYCGCCCWRNVCSCRCRSNVVWLGMSILS